MPGGLVSSVVRQHSPSRSSPTTSHISHSISCFPVARLLNATTPEILIAVRDVSVKFGVDDVDVVAFIARLDSDETIIYIVSQKTVPT